MAYEGWLEFNGVEIINVARTAQLAEALAVASVRVRSVDTGWIQARLGGSGYDDITTAPWYDAGYPASAEFLGVLPLSVTGLDDSGREGAVVEYLTDGGTIGKSRNTTLPIVSNLLIVGRTDRGAEFGRRWLTNVLRDTGKAVFCVGADLRYFQSIGATAPIVHRRDVATTKGITVTRKRADSCSAVWTATVTMTAADPYEYGEAEPKVYGLGGAPFGAGVLSSGSIALVQQGCPQYDYSPIYDPGYPALVPSPSAPDFYPDGWDIVNGMTFDRFWARISSIEPSSLPVVPKITLTTTVEARRVRVSIWPLSAADTVQCEPLFSVVVSYLPPNLDFIIDGEQQAAYAWDGGSPAVQRTDSLVYSPEAKPMRWASFNDPSGLLVTLDIFGESGDMEGAGDVRASVSLIPKTE